MKKLYTSPDPLIISHLQNILESYGICCIIKNEYLAGAAGEIPLTECWPELWIRKDSQYERAINILEKALALQEIYFPSWKCTKCAEELEGQFTSCWRCGESRYR